MNVFIEKEFIEDFEIEYEDNLNVNNDKAKAWKVLYVLLTEYSNINWFIDATEDNYEEIINGSEILTKLSDTNPNVTPTLNFEKHLIQENSLQTIVLAKEKKDWFKKFENNSVLFFCYSNFDEEFHTFLTFPHLVRVDLAEEKIKFDWSYFSFIGNNSNIIFISDPYILSDTWGQKIKDNIAHLLKDNLKNDTNYKIFILSELSENTVELSKTVTEKKLQMLYSKLANYKVQLFLINRLRNIETMNFHDRLLYTNYTITTSGIGFNIKKDKLFNSEIITKSIFDKNTYRKFLNHFKQIDKYIDELKHTNCNDYKTNSEKMYTEFKLFKII